MAFSFRSLNFTGGFADQNLPIVFTLNFVKLWQLLRNIYNFFLFNLFQNRYSHLSNKREFTLTYFEKFHPLKEKIHPPCLSISQIFSTLNSSFIRVMYQFFPKNLTLRVYSNLHVYQRDESTSIKQTNSLTNSVKISDDPVIE